MKVVDAKGTEHEVTPGAWWWADMGNEGVEVVRVATDGGGRWWADTAGWDCGTPFKDVVLLGPVVPYVPSAPAGRNPRYNPQPGDTYTAPPGVGGLTFKVLAVGEDGVTVSAPNRHDGIALWPLDFWISSHGYGTWTPGA